MIGSRRRRQWSQRGRVPIDAADGAWVLLRLTDPMCAADVRAPSSYATSGAAIAYAAPFFLRP